MSDVDDTTQGTDTILAQAQSSDGHAVRMTLYRDGYSPVLMTKRPVWPTYSLEMNALAAEYIELYAKIKALPDAKKDDERFTKGFIYTSQNRVSKINSNLTREERWPSYGKREIEPYILSKILIARHHVARIRTGDEQDDRNLPLGIYVDERITGDDDPRLGTYAIGDENLIARAARIYCPDINKNKLDNLITDLIGDTPIRNATSDESIAPFNNGIYDSKTKTLRPYTPDDIIINKFAVNYVPNAPLPQIVQEDGTIWSPDMFLSSLTGDEEIAMYLFEMISVLLHPFSNFDGMLWLYSTIGCNGKGTYCALLKNLLGPNAYATLNVKQMEQDFRLATISNSYAIIADENPVGTYLDDSSNMKSMATGEAVTLNPKYSKPYKYTYRGLIVQCLNELPRVRDRTPSFIRRLNVVPFERSFLGHENKAIKHHHLKQPEVLEWFASVAMELDPNNLHTPAACKYMKELFQAANNPVQEFWNEISPLLSWDLIPHGLAYEMYKSWMAQNNPNGSVLGRNAFIDEWGQCARDSGDWLFEKNRRYSSAGRMEGPEHCMEQWEAPSWLNENARASNHDGRCTLSDAKRKPQYKGILRKKPLNMNAQAQANASDLIDRSTECVTPERFLEILRDRGLNGPSVTNLTTTAKDQDDADDSVQEEE